jgi:hypothetical protein
MPQPQDPSKQPEDDGILTEPEIFEAILQRHWLQFRIGPIIYVVEPHVYGVMSYGRHALWAWNLIVAGSNPSVKAGWAQYRLDQMRDVRMSAETFERPRPGYTRANIPMHKIHSQL